MKEMKFYRCDECGSIVTFLKSVESLSCCHKDMKEIIPNTTDASLEKHVPEIKAEGDTITVQIGSTPHPMIPEHYIEWIALAIDNKFEIQYLKPGMEPKAVFKRHITMEKEPYTGDNDPIVPNCEARDCNFDYKDLPAGMIAYEYCNIHGLWKKEYNENPV